LLSSRISTAKDTLSISYLWLVVASRRASFWLPNPVVRGKKRVDNQSQLAYTGKAITKQEERRATRTG
jgi:hypothetical protein